MKRRAFLAAIFAAPLLPKLPVAAASSPLTPYGELLAAGLLSYGWNQKTMAWEVERDRQRSQS